jgi:hypothetical protein
MGKLAETLARAIGADHMRAEAKMDQYTALNGVDAASKLA